MLRDGQGRYEVTAFGGERVQAFVPAPLPPNPPLILDGTLQQDLEAAVLALGRLDGIAAHLPDKALFLYAYVRKEAVLSSQIEGTQSSVSDLLFYELEQAPARPDGRGPSQRMGRSFAGAKLLRRKFLRVPPDDVAEVSSYVAALEHGLRLLGEGLPPSIRLLRDVHRVLLSTGRGSSKMPGDFRTSQNWIGGTRPGNTLFVPPPHTVVPDCMAALERFVNTDDDGLPVLVRAALAHLQFETIHPFLDGNGRVGRLLITLLLYDAGVLRQPLLYLSLFFKQHRAAYYDLLNRVRATGDWESWVAFFLEGVRVTAEGALATADRLSALFQDDRDRLAGSGGRRLGSVLRMHDALKSRPILSLPVACQDTGLSFQAAASAMEVLVHQGIARELTGKRRGRLFAYDAYLSVLTEGTEPL